RQAVLAHDAGAAGHQDILLISDGDDPAGDGEWAEGADLARAHKIPVWTVGVGDPETPRPVELPGGRLTHNGTEVTTRLEENPLEEIARRTQGVYFPARTYTLPPGALYREILQSQRALERDESLPSYRQQYSWFFAAALALLTLSLLPGVR